MSYALQVRTELLSNGRVYFHLLRHFGLGRKVEANIAWAKLASMVEGAQLASRICGSGPALS